MDFSKEEFEILNRRALKYKGILEDLFAHWDRAAKSDQPFTGDLVKLDRYTWDTHEAFIEVCPKQKDEATKTFAEYIELITQQPVTERTRLIKKYAEGAANLIARKIRDIEKSLKKNQRKQKMATAEYRERNAANQASYRDRQRQKKETNDNFEIESPHNTDLPPGKK